MTQSRLQFLPLRDAVLCSDCNFISADELGVCPVCNGRSLLSLSRIVGRKADRRPWPGVQVVLELLGFRRRTRRRELNFATRVE